MAPRTPKLDREIRMNWAGCVGLHPKEDVDIFNRLSVARQNEILEIQQVFVDYPHAQTSLIYDPVTRTPYPDQILVRDIIDKKHREQQNLPEVPDWFKYSIPEGAPLEVLVHSTFPDPTVEQEEQILAMLEQHATEDKLLLICTESGKLLQDKPMDGVCAFVWRYARWASGLDYSIPVTALRDLVDGIALYGSILVYPTPAILKFLQERAEALVSTIGGNKHAGASRWARATGVMR